MRVCCERNVVIDKFKPTLSKLFVFPLIWDWIMSREWNIILENHGCYPFMVWEFYYRAKHENFSQGQGQRIIN